MYRGPGCSQYRNTPVRVREFSLHGSWDFKGSVLNIESPEEGRELHFPLSQCQAASMASVALALPSVAKGLHGSAPSMCLAPLTSANQFLLMTVGGGAV